MRRSIALLILVAGAISTTWLRSERVTPIRNKTLTFVTEPRPSEETLKAHLGPFHLEKAWQMELGSWKFGGYSALVPLPDGRMLALSDLGHFLVFAPPGGVRATPRFGNLLDNPQHNKSDVDVESATRDPETGQIWLGLELRNEVVRLNSGWARTGSARPEIMRHWGKNSGPEAMARLHDGRFVLLSEGPIEWWRSHRHEGVVFSGDPVENPEAAKPFVFEGPQGFDPVDMAQLPDGRLLVLMRALVWPFPQRFAGRIVIGDPAQIRPGKVWKVREVARIASSLPIDNFEGMAITPAEDGMLNVWLIADDNNAALQRTLLWKLKVNPADLP
ncbi:esterase-like activity of phytase family protein [Novosphingobium sp. M1R2S20]|uniref:Esterase-like activity of phytase family protein n=1 Tax=Novosphingobium rhizovicinum TaxID=3228928 RepID=A0ABV3RA88_9SPHN